MRPTEKTTPPSTRVAAKPRLASLATTVKKSDPIAMKAPASMPSMAAVNRGEPRFGDAVLFDPPGDLDWRVCVEPEHGGAWIALMVWRAS